MNDEHRGRTIYVAGYEFAQLFYKPFVNVIVKILTSFQLVSDHWTVNIQAIICPVHFGRTLMGEKTFFIRLLFPPQAPSAIFSSRSSLSADSLH